MNMLELQDLLSDTISQVAHSNNLDKGSRSKLFESADMIAKLSKQMINNADVNLRYAKLEAECKNLSDSSIKQIIGK